MSASVNAKRAREWWGDILRDAFADMPDETVERLAEESVPGQTFLLEIRFTPSKRTQRSRWHVVHAAVVSTAGLGTRPRHQKKDYVVKKKKAKL
jgi:hypothetical protein